MLGSAAVLVM